MQQTDILVIGGGIAGTATTCYLAQYGRQVILLEQSELAAEASGLNAGTQWATGWGRTPDLSSTLSMGSLEVFKTLQFDHGYDVEFRQGGSLRTIQTEEEYACKTSPSLVPGLAGCPLHAICTPSSARSPTSTISTCSQA